MSPLATRLGLSAGLLLLLGVLVGNVSAGRSLPSGGAAADGDEGEAAAFSIVPWAAPAHGQAVRLLAPTAAHDALELTNEGRAWLSGLTRPFRVVSVVGVLHTGKSFLASTLLTRGLARGGFAMGHTTEAKTMGVWCVCEGLCVASSAWSHGGVRAICASVLVQFLLVVGC